MFETAHIIGSLCGFCYLFENRLSIKPKVFARNYSGRGDRARIKETNKERPCRICQKFKNYAVHLPL